MHPFTTPSLLQTIWPRWASRQFLSLPIVETLLPVTFGYSLSSQAVVIMRQLRRWKRLWRIIITRMRISKLPGKTWLWWGVTVSSGKSTDVTCKTHLGYLPAQLPWLVDLASLVCNRNWWISCRVSALQSVVAGSISRGGGYGEHCWWDLVRSRQLSSVPVYRA